ncbi:hypothetical protein D3C83_47890 [compost metagenome]
MRKLRERQFDQRLKPWRERIGLAAWRWFAQRPALYAMMTAIGARTLAWLGGARKLIHNLPCGGGWTGGRDLPAAEGQTFRALYRRRDMR